MCYTKRVLILNREKEMQELNAICPICGEEIMLDYTPEIGEAIFCSQCGRSSEVIRVNPLTLQAIQENENFSEFPEKEKENDEDLL